MAGTPNAPAAQACLAGAAYRRRGIVSLNIFLFFKNPLSLFPLVPRGTSAGDRVRFILVQHLRRGTPSKALKLAAGVPPSPPASQALHFGALYAPSQEPRLHSPSKATPNPIRCQPNPPP